MFEALIRHAPGTWETRPCIKQRVLDLSRASEEFNAICKMVQDCLNVVIRSVSRVQYGYNFVQYLLREQMLIDNNNTTQYYKVSIETI